MTSPLRSLNYFRAKTSIIIRSISTAPSQPPFYTGEMDAEAAEGLEKTLIEFFQKNIVKPDASALYQIIKIGNLYLRLHTVNAFRLDSQITKGPSEDKTLQYDGTIVSTLYIYTAAVSLITLKIKERRWHGIPCMFFSFTIIVFLFSFNPYTQQIDILLK